jgi:predicted O-methyltransferase YrrM
MVIRWQMVNCREQAAELIENFRESQPMLGLDAAEFLMECVANTEGDYIEIGSASGGSALMAAMAMGDRAGTVYCIEPFIGMNPLEGVDPMYKAFWENMLHYEIEQRIILFKQYTPPFPSPLHFHRFSVGLIDGNHMGDWPVKDFMELDSRVTDVLLFDNAELEGVAKAISVAVHHDWQEYKTIEYDSVMSKKAGKTNTLVALIRRVPIEHVPLWDKIRRYFDKGLPLC